MAAATTTTLSSDLTHQAYDALMSPPPVSISLTQIAALKRIFKSFETVTEDVMLRFSRKHGFSMTAISKDETADLMYTWPCRMIENNGGRCVSFPASTPAIFGINSKRLIRMLHTYASPGVVLTMTANVDKGQLDLTVDHPLHGRLSCDSIKFIALTQKTVPEGDIYFEDAQRVTVDSVDLYKNVRAGIVGMDNVQHHNSVGIMMTWHPLVALERARQLIAGAGTGTPASAAASRDVEMSEVMREYGVEFYVQSNGYFGGASRKVISVVPYGSLLPPAPGLAPLSNAAASTVVKREIVEVAASTAGDNDNDDDNKDNVNINNDGSGAGGGGGALPVYKRRRRTNGGGSIPATAATAISAPAQSSSSSSLPVAGVGVPIPMPLPPAAAAPEDVVLAARIINATEPCIVSFFFLAGVFCKAYKTDTTARITMSQRRFKRLLTVGPPVVQKAAASALTSISPYGPNMPAYNTEPVVFEYKSVSIGNLRLAVLPRRLEYDSVEACMHRHQTRENLLSLYAAYGIVVPASLLVPIVERNAVVSSAAVSAAAAAAAVGPV